jgi:hypothetical protein
MVLERARSRQATNRTRTIDPLTPDGQGGCLMHLARSTSEGKMPN